MKNIALRQKKTKSTIVHIISTRNNKENCTVQLYIIIPLSPSTFAPFSRKKLIHRDVDVSSNRCLSIAIFIGVDFLDMTVNCKKNISL